MEELISLCLNFILGSGLLGVVIFYRTKQRKEIAQATMAENENKQTEFLIHKQSVDFLSKQLAEAYAELSKLQDMVNDKRNEIVELIRKTKQFEVELIVKENQRRKAEIMACYAENCEFRKVLNNNIE